MSRGGLLSWEAGGVTCTAPRLPTSDALPLALGFAALAGPGLLEVLRVTTSGGGVQGGDVASALGPALRALAAPEASRWVREILSHATRDGVPLRDVGAWDLAPWSTPWEPVEAAVGYARVLGFFTLPGTLSGSLAAVATATSTSPAA